MRKDLLFTHDTFDLAAAEKRIFELKNVLNIVQSKLQDPPPKTRIYYSKSNKVIQYYKIDEKHKKIYLNKNKENLDELTTIYQNEYFAKLSKIINLEISVLEKFIAKFPKEKLSDVFDELPESKKAIVNNFFISDEELLELWKKQTYEPKIIPQDSPKFITLNNLKVRSKSEMMIANELYQQKIPFFYEYPVQISDNLTLYPDFYCLIPQQRKIIIWEHFGLTDYSDYRESMVFKINNYAKKGFYLGDNLFFTVESQKEPLSLQMVKKMISVIF